MIYPDEAENQLLRKPQKIFLHNTSLLYTLQQFVAEPLNLGALRELYFVQALRDAGESVHYSKQGDYRTKTAFFEIGAKNKSAKQIANVKEKAVLVKDDTVVATQQALPLMYLGFVYCVWSKRDYS